MGKDEPVANVVPMYLVADESGSMSGDIEVLDAGLRSLLDAMHEDTNAAAKVRFGVLGFSDSVICHLDPSDLRNLEQMPTFTIRGMTSYAAAFTDLRQRIVADVARFKSEGYSVLRPAVFFLSDGYPNQEDWQSPLAALKDPSFHERPNILAFGVREAPAEIIRQVASQEAYAWVAAQGADTGQAIAEFMSALTRSVVSSGHAVADGNASLQIEPPEDFISLSLETL